MNKSEIEAFISVMNQLVTQSPKKLFAMDEEDKTSFVQNIMLTGLNMNKINIEDEQWSSIPKELRVVYLLSAGIAIIKGMTVDLEAETNNKKADIDFPVSAGNNTLH